MFLETKEVSRAFKESMKCISRNLNNKFQGCFKNVSMKLYFVILFLHISHRSYPSRRMACWVGRLGREPPSAKMNVGIEVKSVLTNQETLVADP